MRPMTMEKLREGDVVNLLFARSDSRRAARELLEFLKNKGGECTAEEMSAFAKGLGKGVPFKFSKTNFYGTILKRFVELGFIAEVPRHEGWSGRAVKVYEIIYQPLPRHRPMGPSFMYFAHVLCEDWNESVEGITSTQTTNRSGAEWTTGAEG